MSGDGCPGCLGRGSALGRVGAEDVGVDRVGLDFGPGVACGVVADDGAGGPGVAPDPAVGEGAGLGADAGDSGVAGTFDADEGADDAVGAADAVGPVDFVDAAGADDVGGDADDVDSDDGADAVDTDDSDDGADDVDTDDAEDGADDVDPFAGDLDVVGIGGGPLGFGGHLPLAGMVDLDPVGVMPSLGLLFLSLLVVVLVVFRIPCG